MNKLISSTLLVALLLGAGVPSAHAQKEKKSNFSKIDQNDDKVLSREEFKEDQKGLKEKDADQRFDAMDYDGNDSISTKEFEFRKLDVNGDRRLDQNEFTLSKGANRNAAETTFKNLDRDKDKSLSWEEFNPRTLVDYLLILAIVLGCLILPFVAGSYLSRSFRMPEYATKIGIILCVLFSITLPQA